MDKYSITDWIFKIALFAILTVASLSVTQSTIEWENQYISGALAAGMAIFNISCWLIFELAIGVYILWMTRPIVEKNDPLDLEDLEEQTDD